MLALRRILGQADRVTTCVFDGVDAGIGGAVADRVGSQIAPGPATSGCCASPHLPQIARVRR